MEKLQINIFDFNLVWRGAIDSVHYLIHRNSWHEISNSEMSISRTAQGVEELGIGRILVVNNQLNKALIIEDMWTSLDEEFWTFNLIPMKAIMNYRICHPTDSGSFSALTQSQVIQELVSKNLINQTRDEDRKFWNSDRTLNMLSVSPIKTYGDTIDFSVDWKTGYLGEAIVSIAKMYGAEAKHPIGWNLEIETDYSGFHFDVWSGTNKSINQTILPPVIFSEEFGNIKNASYEYSIKEWRNVAYMSWNDGTTDKISKIGNTEQGATVSFNRKEIIIDSSKKLSSEVTNEGRSELNKRPHIESFTAEILNNVNTLTTFKENWEIGDIVTIQSRHILKDALLSIDAMVTETEEIYDQGEYSINATFGEGSLTLVDLIKNAINQK
jgi:hypothetical protein